MIAWLSGLAAVITRSLRSGGILSVAGSWSPGVMIVLINSLSTVSSVAV